MASSPAFADTVSTNGVILDSSNYNANTLLFTASSAGSVVNKIRILSLATSFVTFSLYFRASSSATTLVLLGRVVVPIATSGSIGEVGNFVSALDPHALSISNPILRLAASNQLLCRLGASPNDSVHVFCEGGDF